MRNGSSPAGLKIYFDCGTEDDFGFNAGAQAFHDLLVSRKIPHEFHLYPGRHDWAYFASHLEASLSLPLLAVPLIRALLCLAQVCCGYSNTKNLRGFAAARTIYLQFLKHLFICVGCLRELWCGPEETHAIPI